MTKNYKNKLKVAILDVGFGNLSSIKNALDYLKLKNKIVSNPEIFKNFTHLILPGVGSFKKASKKLSKNGWKSALKEASSKKPILGICLGMQLLFSKGTEDGNSKGLEFLNGKCEKFKIKNLPIPHIGFNHVEFKKSNLWKNIPNKSPFYFVHSYRVKNTSKKYNLSTTTYGEKFVSAVEKENIIGTQFHPEKSHSFGLTFIKNFVENYK
tara:strand:- start:213 stop:842 length:630 start_codon:yes stop_codon:yes gene_type:complete